MEAVSMRMNMEQSLGDSPGSSERTANPVRIELLSRSSVPLRFQKLTETPSICSNTPRQSSPIVRSKIARLAAGWLL